MGCFPTEFEKVQSSPTRPLPDKTKPKSHHSISPIAPPLLLEHVSVNSHRRNAPRINHATSAVKGSVLDFGNSPISPPLPLEHVPVNPNRRNASRVIRLWTVDERADRINLERFIRRKLHRLLVNFTSRIVRFQPPIVMIRRDDDRHPVMQRRNRLISGPGDDGERFNRFARRRFLEVGVIIANCRWPDPPVPQTCKTKRLTAFQHHPERLPLPVHLFPLKKTVRRNQAPPGLVRLPKRRPALNRLRPRIDQGIADALVLRPGWNQTPPHQFHRRPKAILVKHWRELCRRDVVARPKKWHPRHDDADQFDQLAEIFCRRITSAHAHRLSHARDNACPTEKFFSLACAARTFRIVPAAGEFRSQV